MNREPNYRSANKSLYNIGEIYHEPSRIGPDGDEMSSTVEIMSKTFMNYEGVKQWVYDIKLIYKHEIKEESFTMKNLQTYLNLTDEEFQSFRRNPIIGHVFRIHRPSLEETIRVLAIESEDGSRNDLVRVKRIIFTKRLVDLSENELRIGGAYGVASIIPQNPPQGITARRPTGGRSKRRRRRTNKKRKTKGRRRL